MHWKILIKIHNSIYSNAKRKAVVDIVYIPEYSIISNI